MATIREYFDTDAQALTIHGEWKITKEEGGPQVAVIAKIAYDFEANARYWYFYVPPADSPAMILSAIFSSPEFAACRLGSDGDGVHVQMGLAGYSEYQSTETLQFTKRVHLYLDYDLTRQDRQSLVEQALARGFYLVIRDREYARKRSEALKPLAFISHDSRDKDALVRKLAHAMTGLMCPVWYDEYSLKVGDSLRESIEGGLKEARKCVIVLSPHFFSNQGWTKAEFDSIFTREILEEKNIILPVWHGVSKKEVYDYSPRLADKVGLPSSMDLDELARKLVSAVKAD